MANQQLERELENCQGRLYALIFSLVPSSSQAQDILQETNLTVLHKSEQLNPNRPAWPWIAGIAKNKVRSYLRDRGRDRHLFSEEIVDSLAKAANDVPNDDARESALRFCIEQLPADERALLSQRYSGESVNSIAKRTNRSPAAVSATLYRLRKKLHLAIQQQLSDETTFIDES